MKEIYVTPEMEVVDLKQKTLSRLVVITRNGYLYLETNCVMVC